MSELRSCAKRFGGLAVMILPWLTSRSFIRPCLHAYLHSSRSQTSIWSTCFV